MRKPKDISENELHKIWMKQSFTSVLKTQSGDVVSVLSHGDRNVSASGPDFKNARLRIGNLIYVGDVEIDGDYSNWKSHGHNIDSKYNKVILHISLTNNSNHHYIYTKDGRKAPTLTLERFLQKRLFNKANTAVQINADRQNGFVKCVSVADTIEVTAKKEFVAKLGVERFSKKCDRIFQRLKELSYIAELKISEPTIRYSLHPEFIKKQFTSEDFKDKLLWQQLLYELLFEALGYSQNKEIMKKLARSIPLNFINNKIDKNNFSVMESLFFNVSGLMPEVKNLPVEETSDYTRELANEWEKISKDFDGERFSETDWHFFRIRPHNFPTIRIVGGIRYINFILSRSLISIIINKLEDIENLTVAVNSIRSLLILKSSGYWKTHYIFDLPAKKEIKYFIGFARADEIIVNIILPFFMVYFDVFSKPELTKKILQIYNIYEQRNDNKITKELSTVLGIEDVQKKTIYSQGLIELYRTYCSKNKCPNCEIGRVVFS